MPGMTPDDLALLFTLQFAIAVLGFVIAVSIWLEISEYHMHLPVPNTNDDHNDPLSRLPHLPSPGQRWTAQCKAAVIEAVRGNWMPIEEACRLYNISVDEFLAWQRLFNQVWYL